MPIARLKRYTKKTFKLVLSLILLTFILLEIIYLLLSSSSFITKLAFPEISKRSGIKITAEELNLKIFSGINAKKVHIIFPSGLEIEAQQVDLSFIFKKLFEDTFHLNNLTVSGLKFNDPKIGSAIADLQVSGSYLFTEEQIKVELAGELETLYLNDQPSLNFNHPAKLNLNLDIDPKTLKTILIKTKIENLDLTDSEIGSSQATIEFSGSYSTANGDCKGELKSDFQKLAVNYFPKLLLKKDSSFSTDFEYTKKNLNLKKFTIKLQPEDQELLKINGQGIINLPKNDYDLKVDLQTKSIELQKLLALFDPVAKTNATNNKNSAKKQQSNSPPLKLAIQYQIETDRFAYLGHALQAAKATGAFLMPKSQRPELASLPGDLSYQFIISANQLDTYGLKLTKLQTKGFGSDQQLKIEALNFLQGEKASVDTNGTLEFTNKKFTLYLALKDLQLESILPALCGEKCQAIKGKIPLAKLALQGTASGEEFSNSLTGTVAMTGDNVFLPARFQDIPPVNLIFLPYSIVSEISSLTIVHLLPAGLLNISSKADNALSESGRIKINDFNLQVLINQEAYDLQTADFHMNLVPSANFSGSIYKNKRLNIELGMWLLGIQIRIPVGGTVSLPLPQLYKLPITLVKGLGLSVLDLIPGQNN